MQIAKIAKKQPANKKRAKRKRMSVSTSGGCCCSATFTPVAAEGCRVTGATGAGTEREREREG